MRQTGLRHSVEERFSFIELRVFWHGRINRADLQRRFGVSQTQASQDFKLYQELAPDNLIYDGVEKTYLPSESFSARFAELSADSYLAPLMSIGSGLLSPQDAWLRQIPEFHVTPSPARGIHPEILRDVVRAVDDREALEICYQSMSVPDPSWRSIEPHAYAFDGFRWHVRAFCLKDRTFKDFLLSRILSTRHPDNPVPATTSGADDAAWNSWASLVIAPHPELSEGQRRAIVFDYGMDEQGQSVIKVRRAMLYYALKRLGLDTDPSARSPSDQQIVLLSSEVVDADYR